MKTAQSGNLQGVLYDELVQIVRGTTSFSISKYELEDLIIVLQRLSSGLDLTASSATTAPMARTVSSDIDLKGRVWHVIKRYLDSCPRAQGMNSMVRTVKRACIVEGDPTSLIQSILIERLSSKDILKSRSGRYTRNVRVRQVSSTV